MANSEEQAGNKEPAGSVHILQMVYLQLPDILKPLTKLTEEKHAFRWTPEVEAIFQFLKNRSHGTRKLKNIWRWEHYQVPASENTAD
jgi:hypothetical protein